MKLILVSLAAFLGLFQFALAGGSGDCPDSVLHTEGLQIQTIWSEDSQTCMIGIDPAYTPNLVYRSYLFGSDGSLLVFNSFGEGPENQFTGARSYYLYPRKATPSAKLGTDGNVLIQSSTGGAAIFDAKTGAFLSLSGAVIHEADKVLPDNQGGLEIEHFDGIVLDLGFRLGADPIARPKASSEFRDGFGHRCAVRNDEVFVYPASPGPEITARFATDAELAAFLATRCPEIVADALLK